MKYYPVSLNLSGKDAVVVGGGRVAERKVRSLVRTGSKISVVSPRLTAGLKRLVRTGRLQWARKAVAKKDLKGADIVIAATSDNKINRDIARWAKELGAWVNVVDEKRSSDFISPAVIRKEKVIVAVYTDGREPRLSRDLKNFLKEHWDEFLSYRNRLQVLAA